MKKKYFLPLLCVLVFTCFTNSYAQYCTPTYATGCTLSDYIDDFMIKDSQGSTIFSHLGTGCSPNAYGDFTSDSSLEIDVEAGESYDFQITHGTSGEYVTIWVDINQDGTFDDPSERVFQSTSAGSTTSPTQGTINVPNINAIITTRMRIMNAYSGASDDPCNPGSSYGEVHDYKITITGVNPNCLSPSNFALKTLANNEATFTWDTIYNADNGYTWRLMTQGDDPDVDTPLDSATVSNTVDSLTVSGLIKGDAYDIFLRSECSASEQSVWEKISFYDADPGIDCNLPKEIDSLPYVDYDNTGRHFNIYSGNPGDSCNVDDDYLSGYDVVYHYQADDEYLLTVDLDSLSDFYSGVFIYESCADIGEECATEGSVSEDSMDAHGTDILTQQGQDYYIVISSAAPVDSLDYNLIVNKYTCSDIPAPSGYATPYFIQGDSLPALIGDAKIRASSYNEGFKWYKDAALTDEITDPDNEIITENTYYLTQTILGCEGQAFAITPQEFKCSDLDPDILTPDIELCIPGGNVVLRAQPSPAGSQIYWYDSPTDTVPVEKNTNSLDLGYIPSTSADTISYWVSEVRIEGGESISQSVGPENPAAVSSSGGNTSSGTYYMEFDVLNTTTIVSVDVFSASSGQSSSIEITDDAGTVIADIPYTTTSSGETTPTTVPLNVKLQPGTGYRMKQGTPIISLYRNTSGAVYPFTSSDINIISNSFSAAYYYYFYNWKFGSGTVICESDRKKIDIIVNDQIPSAPNIESPYVLCGEDNFTLDDIDVDGGNIKWYNKKGTPLSPDETIINDGDTYYVLDASGVCVSDIAEVKFVIRELSNLPTADTIQDFTSGQTLSDLTVFGNNLKWYADADKEDLIPVNTDLIDGATYYVTQTMNGYCESEALGITVNEVMGVETSTFYDFSYYPNPVKNSLNISANNQIYQVELFNLLGQSVMLEKPNDSDVKIDISDLEIGTYIMKVNIEGKSRTFKVIKE